MKRRALLFISLFVMLSNGLNVHASNSGEQIDNELATAYISDTEKTITVTEFKELSLLNDDDEYRRVKYQSYPWYGQVEGYQLVLADSLTFIGRDAFNGSGLTGDLVIPDSVTEIGYGAFAECPGFTGDLVIPDSVTEIEALAFNGCSGFDGELVLPDSITKIGYQAFDGCSGLKGDLVIPDSVTTVERSAFDGCTNFNSLTIPDSVTSIETSAFGDCPGITTLNIGNGVVELGHHAFWVEAKDKDKGRIVTTVNSENPYVLNYNFEGDNRPDHFEVEVYSNNKLIETQEITRGEKIVEPTPEIPDISGSDVIYEFEGWYTDSDYTEEWDFDTPISDYVSLIAKWNIREIRTVTFDPGNGEGAFTQRVAEGDKPTLPDDPTKEGYIFTGWYAGEEVYTDDMPITEDTTLAAHWDVEATEKGIGQRLVDAVKRVILIMAFSLIPLVILAVFILWIIFKIKKVSVLNDRNRDEYKSENFIEVYKTSVKTEGNAIAEIFKQEDRVWTLTIPCEVINERVTDDFKIILNKYFCKRYNGEQLIVVVDTDDRDLDDETMNHGYIIDKQENEIIFTLKE